MSEYDGQPIPKEELARAARKLARKIAAAIIRTMAETDYNYTQIAARIGKTERDIANWMQRLIDGDGSGAMLDHVSDILLAMGCELDWHVVRAVPILPPRDHEGSQQPKE